MGNNTQEAGALWTKTASNGKPYTSGTITIDGKKHPIVIFANDYKKAGSKQPDYRIFLSQDYQKDVAKDVAEDDEAAERKRREETMKEYNAVPYTGGLNGK